jgi:hypothetical protein
MHTKQETFTRSTWVSRYKFREGDLVIVKAASIDPDISKEDQKNNYELKLAMIGKVFELDEPYGFFADHSDEYDAYYTEDGHIYIVKDGPVSSNYICFKEDELELAFTV